jgi:hypothetical protein
MIESQVIKILNLESRTGTIELYKNKKSLRFFSLMRMIMKQHNFSMFFYLVLRMIFPLQILIELLSLPLETSDTITKLSTFFGYGLLVDTNITDKSTFTGFSTAVYIFVGVYILLLIYLLFCTKDTKFVLPIRILAMLNFALADLLFIPIVGVTMRVLKCDSNSNHAFLGEACFSSGTHITFLLISFVALVFFSTIMFIFTYYMNEIGSIGDSTAPARVNCNYELIANILKFVFFVLMNLVKFLDFTDDTRKTMFLLIKVVLLIFSIFMLVYINQRLYYFEPVYNLVTRAGWSFILWSSIIAIIKQLCDLYDTTIFHLFGWITIYVIIYKTELQKESDLLNDLNIFNLPSLKGLVSVNEKILSYCTTNKNYKLSDKGTSQTLANSFDEVLEREEELNVNHKKFIYDVHVQNKFKNKTDMSLLSLVNVTYEYYLHMRKTKSDLNEENVFLHTCYFLIKYLKNICYCSYLCTKVKITSHKNKFLHFQLTEYIKDKLIFKMNKISSTESIKQIQIGTLLAYEYYLNLFFSKLHEEISKQCSYFSIFKKEMLSKDDKGGDSGINLASNFKAENFLGMGEDIMNIKDEIESAYKQILLIYPTHEIKVQFFSYLNLVMDDEERIRNEEKIFSEKLMDYINEKGPIYKSLFNPNSCIIIVDGFINLGALLYTTPNFTRLFGLENSQILNMTIHDLVPTAIEQFHYEVVMNGIKYSNLSTIFKKQRILFIRGPYGQLAQGVVYIRSVPDLSNGMIYMVSVIKVEETHTTCCAALDDNFIINGFTNMMIFDIDPHTFTLVHIAYYIPNIFLFIKYNKLLGYHFDDTNEEHMAVFYRLMPDKGTKRQLLDNKIEKLFKKIKAEGSLRLLAEDEDIVALTQNVEAQSEASYTIVYKVVTKSFVNNTYKYHTMSINKLDVNMKFDTSVASSVNNSNNKVQLTTPIIAQEDVNEIKGSEFFARNLNNESSHLASVFSGGSATSNNSSQVQMSMKERLYNLTLSKKRLVREQGEIQQIKMMKIICLFFTLITITLSIVSSRIIEDNFYSINQFTVDNLLLNKTKIFMTCIYAYALNINDKKYALYNDKSALTKGVLEYVNYIHYNTESSIGFAEDLRLQLEDKKKVYLTISNGEFILNTMAFIDLILSNTLKYTAELNNAAGYAINQILWGDLIRLTTQYINDDSITGYTMDYQSEKFQYTSYFVTNNVLFIINIAVIIVIIILFLFLSYKILQYEKKLLLLAKNFKTPLFIKYLTNLIDINRNYNSANKEDLDKSQEGDGEEVKKEKEKDKKKGKKNEQKHEEGEKRLKGKRRQEDPKKKKNDMNFERIKSSFTRNCLTTVFKIMIVLILSLFYYVVTIVLINGNVTTTLEFLQLKNNLEMYFQTNFRNFFNIKNKLNQLEQPGTDTVAFEKPSIYSLGNLLFEVKSYFPSDNANIINLDTLFTGNVCSIMPELQDCTIYQNAILTRGLDQAIVQTNLLLSNFIEEASNIRKVNNTLVGVYEPTAFFPQYEQFITIHLYYSYKLYTDNIMELKSIFISSLLSNLYMLLYCFLGLWTISFVLLLYIINKMRKLFFSLIIFFNIIPSKHILEDVELTNDIIKLKNKL